jgi:hypothetical protein
MAAPFTVRSATARSNLSKFENVSRIDRRRFQRCAKMIPTLGAGQCPNAPLISEIKQRNAEIMLAA